MNVEQMRVALSGLYGQQWREKVRKMRDSQVVAIYKKFQAEGKIK